MELHQLLAGPKKISDHLVSLLALFDLLLITAGEQQACFGK